MRNLGLQPGINLFCQCVFRRFCLQGLDTRGRNDIGSTEGSGNVHGRVARCLPWKLGRKTILPYTDDADVRDFGMTE
jgi:hypothetical protein